MPFTTVTNAIAGTQSSINPLFSPISIIIGIITKMSGKISFLKKLFRRTSKITFAFMPKYKQFIPSVIKDKIKEKYLLIDFEDYVKTILNENEVSEFNKFIEKSDSDLYKQIVTEMVNKLFNNDINTRKKIIYFIDNEKVFKLIDKKRKVYIYPKKPDDIDSAGMYSSIVDNIRKKILIYKSFTDLEDLIASRV